MLQRWATFNAHHASYAQDCIWYNNHPFTPPSFTHRTQTILDSKQSMIPIRLEAIVDTEKSHSLQQYWKPKSVLILSALDMDCTHTLYLPCDLTKTSAVIKEHVKSIIENTITNPEKLLDTYSIIPDFIVIVSTDFISTVDY